MINFIILTNCRGEKLELDLRRPEQSGFLVSSPTGLTPMDSSVTTETFADGLGSYFSRASVAARTITIPMIFYEDNIFGHSVEDLRFELYRLFKPMEKIKIKVETDKRTCEIPGHVEKLSVTVFAQQCEAVMSVVCPDPFFVGMSLEHLEDIKISSKQNIAYPGDIETGFILDILSNVDDYMDGISVCSDSIGRSGDILEHQECSIGTILEPLGISGNILSGDKLVIDTRKHNIGMAFVRNGIEYNGMKLWRPTDLNSTFAFPELYPGKNEIKVINSATREPINGFSYEIHYPLYFMGV